MFQDICDEHLLLQRNELSQHHRQTSSLRTTEIGKASIIFTMIIAFCRSYFGTKKQSAHFKYVLAHTELNLAHRVKTIFL